MNQLPQAWVDRMKHQLRDEMPAFLKIYEEPSLRGIRFNPWKSVPELSVWQSMDKAVPWEKNGWYLEPGIPAGTTVWHEAGAFYLQEPSAMIPAAVLDVQPGETVLDLCSAPGGKATQIGLAMGGKGLLAANEPVEKRARILSRNIERMGVPNAIVTCAKPEQLAENWTEMFDAVMVDAPCSGEGMFRRDPESRTEWSEENASGCVRRQREILRSAARLVKPGGRMVYSTCTFNPEENEETVKWFLKEFRDYEPEPFFLNGAEGKEGWFTCYPHRTRGEGQFAAKLRRRGTPAESEFHNRTDLPAPDRWIKESWKKSFPGMPEPTHLFGDRLVHMEQSLPLKGIRVFRTGLHLGEFRGKNPIPDHAAAMAITAGDAKHCGLSEAEAAKYLAGETIERIESGWVLMRYHGLTLGWAKGSEGILRNHYPKGLRNDRILCKIPN